MNTITLPAEVEAVLNQLQQGSDVDLPMLPQVAQEVMTLVQNPQVDAARLAAVLHRDQALATHVLRVANSPLYRGEAPMVSLQQAVSRLGLRTLSDIAVSVAVRGSVFQCERAQALMVKLWRHSLAAALFAKEISRARRRNVESAFLCGLLHDIGRPLVVATVLQRVAHADLGTLRQAMDVAHVPVGARLAEVWQLPPQVVESVRHHHDYRAAANATEAVMTTALADELAHWAAPELRPALGEEQIRMLPVLEGLNLYPDEVQTLLAQRDALLAQLQVLA